LGVGLKVFEIFIKSFFNHFLPFSTIFNDLEKEKTEALFQ